MVRKRRKSLWGCCRCSAFSSLDSHCGARCTFLRHTHVPFLAASLTALSASEKPSGEPMAIDS
jgi:hypothetical protein